MSFGECSSSCLHNGTTYGICRMVTETNSVTCLEHGYQPDVPKLTLIFCTCLKYKWVMHKNYCGVTYYTSSCVATKVVFNILIFFSKTTGR